jgi:hypothetical protein
VGKVRVDLSLPRLQERIRSRFDLLTGIAEELCDGFFDTTEVMLVDDQLARSIEAYYLMIEAFKVERLGQSGTTTEDEKRTQNPKKAAFMAASLLTFRPLRIIDPSQPVRKELSAISNQVLAMEFAGTVLDSDFNFLTKTMERRLFRFMAAIQPKCLNEYIVDQELNSLKTVYDIDVSADLASIEALILLFELMVPPFGPRRRPA